jgi:hypothetical protein
MKSTTFYFATAVAYGSELRIAGNVFDVVTDLVRGQTHTRCALHNVLNLAINGTDKKVTNATDSKADRLN